MLAAYLAPVALALFGLVALTRLRASGDDEDAGGDPGWGGGDGNVPAPPRGPVDPDSGAAWWPEFERELAAWVERTQRVDAGAGARHDHPGVPAARG